MRGLVLFSFLFGSFAFAETAEVRIHSEAKTSWQARLKSIENAQSRIFIEVFYLENDSIGLQLVNSLIQAKIRKPQLDVRLLLDAWGSSTFPKELLCELERKKIATKLFSPPTALEKATQERNHRKIWIADDTAIVGGRNISEENFSPAHALLDWDVEVQGGLVEKISASFLDGWRSEKSLRTPCAGVKPVDLSKSFLSPIESIVMPRWHNVTAEWNADLPGGRSTSRPVHQKTNKLIQASRNSLFIENYIFLPVTNLADSISGAFDRGVQLSLMTNGPMSGHWMGELTSCSSLVEVNYWLKKNISVTVTKKDHRTHGKAFLIDDQILSIGSFNFDGRSALWNAETLLTLKDSPQLIAEFKQSSALRLSQGHKVKSLEDIFKAYQFTPEQENKCRVQSKWRSILGLFL